MNNKSLLFQTGLLNPELDTLTRLTTISPEDWQAMPILDRLLIHAKSSAEASIRRFDRLPRTYWALLPNGEMVTTPLDAVHDHCEEFCAIVRPLCIGLSATACALATQYWNKDLGLEVASNRVVRTSEPDGLRDQVLLFVARSGRRKATVLPILRNEVGDFSGFGEPESLNMAKARHGTLNFFPASPPTAAERVFAIELVVEAEMEGFLP